MTPHSDDVDRQDGEQPPAPVPGEHGPPPAPPARVLQAADTEPTDRRTKTPMTATTGRFSDARAHLELLMPADQAVPGWRGLDPEPRWAWFQALYAQAAHLDGRYRLGLRSGWWEDDVQVEILASLGAWVAMFDYANWTDPEGKARLILGLPGVRELLRGGAQQFDPGRDRDTFEQHLREQLGAQQPDDAR